jgi:arginyl-tRNA synthetase
MASGWLPSARKAVGESHATAGGALDLREGSGETAVMWLDAHIRLPQVTPTDLVALVRASVTDVLGGRGLASDALLAYVDITRPRNPVQGDYATSVALRAAKRVGVAPLELAGWLANDLSDRPGIATAEVAGAGFVNLRLAAEARGEAISQVLAAGQTRFAADELAGRTVVLAPPSVGPVRPHQLRQARTAALTAALANLLTGGGARVKLIEPPGASLDAVPDAVRYALLGAPAAAALDLDLELLASPVSENPGYAARFAHACLAGVLRQAADLGMRLGSGAHLPGHSTELALVGVLGDYPDVLRAAAVTRRPDRVVRCVDGVVAAYHGFSDACRVLPMGDEPINELYQARLALCAAAHRVLAGGLRVLGVTAPERL